jgi:hypothetical protein
MFLFVFGLSWLLFSSLFLGIMIISTSQSGAEIPIFVFIILGLFVAIGLFMFIKGLKKIIQNKKTEKYGEICYGIITNVYPDGSYVNDAPEYQADVYLYITSEGRTETITEIIGFDPMKYPIKSYVKVKYYQGDINIEEGLSSIKDIPMATQRYFKEYEDFREQTEDIIIVNGKKYKRIDE